jgi:nucleoside-diphosphate-sugar epimerase
MQRVLITGSSGFLGSNLIPNLSKKYIIEKFNRNESNKFNADVIIHLAGKAHDLKQSSLFAEYYKANTDLTKKIFDKFLKSSSKIFIFMSSVKAVRDNYDNVLDENVIASPTTDYGKSKLMAEQYILSKELPLHKKVFILRPCMIYGPGNKGNLNLLYNIVLKGIPWPLGNYHNKRSFCSVNNLIYIINQLISSSRISSGIYNISDDDSLSTNELINLINKSINKKSIILKIPKKIVSLLAKFGDISPFPLNSDRLDKLTSSYVVSNKKITAVLDNSLPENSKSGLSKVFRSFYNN